VKLGAAFPNPPDRLRSVVCTAWRRLQSPDFPRLSQAISHYHVALRHWDDGGPVAGVGSIFTPVILGEALGYSTSSSSGKSAWRWSTPSPRRERPTSATAVNRA
jgi:hypothetical protein